MEKRILIINIILLTLIVFSILFIITKYYETANDTEVDNECMGIDSLVKLKGEACYDSSTKNILLSLKRYKDQDYLKDIKIYFNDPIYEEYLIDEIPQIGETKKYRLQAEQNPKKINLMPSIKQNIIVCNEPKIILSEDCSKNQSASAIAINFSVENISSTYIEVGRYNEDVETIYSSKDTLSKTLTDQDKVFPKNCMSNWICSEWEACINNIQKRRCEDKNHCKISTEIPSFTRSCNTCEEDWICEWSDCIDGYSSPRCIDRNDCDTEFSKPTKIKCNSGKQCNANILCEEWSKCNLDYNFMDLLGGTEKLKGTKTRLCIDKNKCLEPQIEEQACSLRIDIYTRIIVENTEKYIEIYDRMDNRLLARIKIPKEESPALNMDLR